MLGFRSILLPVSFGLPPRRTLALAEALRRLSDGEIHAVHVLEPVPAVGTVGEPPVVTSQVAAWSEQQGAARALAGEASAGVAPHRVELLRGRPADAVLSCADERGCDLIALATHGRSGARRALLGSVAEEIVRRAGRPVLVVREARRDGEEDAEPADAAGPPIERILATTDLSDASAAGLAAAIRVAREVDAELTVLHVIDRTVGDSLAGLLGDRRARTEALVGDAGAKLEALVSEQLDAVGGGASDLCVHEQVSVGNPARDIARYADTLDVDLVVMAASGRSGPTELLLGGTTERVVRLASRPLLVVPAGAEPVVAAAPEGDEAVVREDR